jgi:hypothetical protein
MSFRLSLYIVPHVRSYDEARAFHAKAAKKPWRNTSRTPVNSYNTAYYADHALPGKRSRTCGVRMENENIIFRLHTTDVITWRPDGSVRVNVYHSQSTCGFINHFIPRRMWFDLHPHGYVLRKLDDYVAIPLRGDLHYLSRRHHRRDRAHCVYTAAYQQARGQATARGGGLPCLRQVAQDHGAGIGRSPV